MNFDCACGSVRKTNFENDNHASLFVGRVLSPLDDGMEKPGKLAQAIDDMLSSKMKKMSFEERSNGLNDLHGVSDLEPKTPEEIQIEIDKMSQALSAAVVAANAADDKGDNNTKDVDITMIQAYKKALSVSASYVEQLKLGFLRAEEYNSKAAAERLIRFFHRKLELFGEEKLVEDITMEDLSEEEMNALSSGAIQVLSERDRAGRAILFFHGQFGLRYTTKALVRILFYLCMAALQDEETQTRGVVGIFFGVGQQRNVNGRTFQYWQNWIALPWRVAAFHHCMHNDSALVLYAATLIICKLMESRNVCRFRLHVGTSVECIYNLMTFGISKDNLPIRMDGTLDLSNNNEILKALKEREKLKKPTPENQYQVGGMVNDEQSVATEATESVSSTTKQHSASKNELILVPGSMDVLMGRGRHPESRPGAMRLRHLLLEHKAIYDKSSKPEKRQIMEMVLNRMKDSGCRFLTNVPGGFAECDDSTALRKVSHGFRNLRIKERRIAGSTSDDTDSEGKDRQSRKRSLS